MIKISAFKCLPGAIATTRGVHEVAPDNGLLNWLIFSTATMTPSKNKVVWSLDDFTTLLFPTLPPEVVEELNRPPHRARHHHYKLYYLEGKMFGVSLNNSDADIYELAQYYPNDDEPETVEGIQEKANQLQATLEELGVKDPPSLSSPLACLKNHDLMKSMEGSMPSILDLPEELMELMEVAYVCTPREWISNFKIGHFPKLWKHDISSAFPAEAAKLPDLTECYIAEATESEIMEAEAGFMIGDFTVFPDHPYAFCSPFMTVMDDGTPYNFVGTERNYRCSQADVKLLYEFGMGKFKFKKGWGIGWYEPKFPLANAMNVLFAMRGDNPLRSYLLKRGMNGIVGKFLETRKDAGDEVIDLGKNYNPLYHAMVTNPVRLKVFRALVEHGVTQEELVHIGVDGFRSTRMLHLPGVAPLGGWRCAGSEPAFVLSPGSLVTHERAVRENRYNDLLEECTRRPTARLLGRDPKSKIDVAKLFLHQNRDYHSFPRNAKDLLLKTFNSTPIRLGGRQ